VTRVRALHPFAPTEAGELGFEKGDVIKVGDLLFFFCFCVCVRVGGAEAGKCASEGRPMRCVSVCLSSPFALSFVCTHEGYYEHR
jgi:hypothetical protein